LRASSTRPARSGRCSRWGRRIGIEIVPPEGGLALQYHPDLWQARQRLNLDAVTKVKLTAA